MKRFFISWVIGCFLARSLAIGQSLGVTNLGNNTQLLPMCMANQPGGGGPNAPYPTYQFAALCPSQYISWASGAVDTKRHRLIIKGGGHSDYHGNDVMAVTYGATHQMLRIIGPDPWCNNGNGGTDYTACPNGASSPGIFNNTDPSNPPACTLANPLWCWTNSNGSPAPRHTFGGMAYLPTQDAVYFFEGTYASGTDEAFTWWLQFADDFLSGSATSGQTSITVSTSFSATATPFYATWDTEVIQVTNVSGTTWTIARGANNSTATSHSNGSRLTASYWVARDPVPDAGVNCGVANNVYCDPLTTGPAAGGAAATYDAVDDTVIVAPYGTNSYLYKYYPATNRYLQLNRFYTAKGTQTAEIDPVHNRLWWMGNVNLGLSSLSVIYVDLSGSDGYIDHDVSGSVTGCTKMISYYPGFSFDQYTKKIVGYPGTGLGGGGGQSVYVFDPVGQACTAQLLGGATIANQNASQTGTFGLFRYIPDIQGSFVYASAGGASGNVLLMGVDPIAPTITTTSPITTGTHGTPYTFTFAATGLPALMTWSVISGTLPPGLSLASNGVLSGTPSLGGTFMFTVQASNGVFPAAAKNITAAMNPLCQITSIPFPGGIVNQPYVQPITTTECASPSFMVTAGNLPTGLNLNSGTGVVSGTPTLTGTSDFTVTVTDANGNPVQPFSLTVVGGAGTTALGFSGGIVGQ